MCLCFNCSVIGSIENLRKEKWWGEIVSNQKGRRCPFKSCILPDNNARYWIQFIYLIISTTFLALDIKKFTFFTILMYTAPIVMDLTSTYSESKGYVFGKTVFLTLNALYVVFCIVGAGGFFVDMGESVKVVETSMVFAGRVISKYPLFYGLIPDIIIPVMMYFACPTKKTMKVQKVATENMRS